MQYCRLDKKQKFNPNEIGIHWQTYSKVISSNCIPVCPGASQNEFLGHIGVEKELKELMNFVLHLVSVGKSTQFAAPKAPAPN